MQFATEKKLTDFVKETRDSARPGIVELATRVGINQSYFIGSQWIADNMTLPSGYRGLGRYISDYSPDSSKLRVTANKTTEYVIKSSSATYPHDFSVDVVPSGSEYGIDAIARSQAVASVTSAAIDDSGILEMARTANHARCISGGHILALYIRNQKRPIPGEDGMPTEVTDSKVEATTFETYRLVLDPANPSPDLQKHEYVGYYDVWTLDKINSVLGEMMFEAGIKLDPEKLQTVGQLMPVEVEMARMSKGQLYQDYLAFSKTKGAVVQQWHFKDESGRFSRWYVLIDTEQTGVRCLNFQNPESPFGGCGLPMVHIRGYAKPRTPWGIGDVAMLRDKQDRLNLLSSLIYRVVQKSAGYQWMVDLRAFPKATNADDVKDHFTNVVAGIIPYKPQLERGVNPPQLVQTPPPQPIMLDMASQIAGEDMRDSVFRAEINYGVGKSHVPHATNELLIRESGQVLGIRAEQDVTAYEQLIEVLAGTYIKLAQDGSPSVLGRLQREGMDADDFAVISTIDPYYPACNIVLRQGASHYVSPQERQATMDNALTNKAVTPMEWRMAKATDIDTPLFNQDRRFARAITQKVEKLCNGVPWEPIPLGSYGEYALNMLREASLDRRVQADPALAQLVSQALQSQMQTNAMELAMTNPQPEGGGTGLPGEAQDATLQSATIGDLISGAA